MSWEIYASSIAVDAPLFAIDDVRAVFKQGSLCDQGRYGYRDSDGFYADGHIALYEEEESHVSSIVVRRIYGNTALGRLLEVASHFDLMIYWAADEDEPFIAVPNKAMFDRLPPDCHTCSPPPIITPTAEQLAAAIFSEPMTKENWEVILKEYYNWHDKHERNQKFVEP